MGGRYGCDAGSGRADRVRPIGHNQQSDLTATRQRHNPGDGGDTDHGGRQNRRTARCRPTAILFFSYGCGECVGGGKSLAAARAAVEKAGGSAKFLAVDIVPTEKPADVRHFLDQIGGTSLPAVVDTNGALTSRYQVTAPTTALVIDPSGQISYRGHAPSQDQILAALGSSAAR